MGIDELPTVILPYPQKIPKTALIRYMKPLKGKRINLMLRFNKIAKIDPIIVSGIRNSNAVTSPISNITMRAVNILHNTSYLSLF